MPAPAPDEIDKILNVLAGWPRWLVAACATVLVSLLLWVMTKVLKWSLYILIVVVLVAGALMTLKLLLV